MRDGELKMGKGYEKEEHAGGIALDQEVGGYKRRGIEKRINREQVLCQRWGAMKERRHSAWGCISLGKQREERESGGVRLSWS